MSAEYLDREFERLRHCLRPQEGQIRLPGVLWAFALSLMAWAGIIYGVYELVKWWLS